MCICKYGNIYKKGDDENNSNLRVHDANVEELKKEKHKLRFRNNIT